MGATWKYCVMNNINVNLLHNLRVEVGVRGVPFLTKRTSGDIERHGSTWCGTYNIREMFINTLSSIRLILDQNEITVPYVLGIIYPSLYSWSRLS